jgi:hypothetical protein
MIDLPDELILLLLEKIDGNSLLRCRKTCRLLYRISLDRILLLKFNGIITTEDENGILLPEEVMNNRDLFTTVIEDGRWRRMINNLIKRQFRSFETLMPDNGVQSFLIIYIIYDATWSDAWNVIRCGTWKPDGIDEDIIIKAVQNDSIYTIQNSWHGARDIAWRAIEHIALNIALRTWNAVWNTIKYTQWSNEAISIIRNIIVAEFDPTIIGERARYVTEYIYMTRIIHNITNMWDMIYHHFDGFELTGIVQPFWNRPFLQHNTYAMEYKRLFSAGENELQL